MIGYVTLGTNRLAEAASFYDKLLALAGAGRVYEGDNFVAWSTSSSAPAVSVIEPYDGKEATVGNGVMVALAVDTPDKVQALHAKALELGGTDDGAPGQRMGAFYAAYFRDLDGNKLNAFCMVDGESS